MKAVKFTLTGRTAFFKKPDVNNNIYFTYNHIHKIALYGLLGAVIGLQGHAQQSRDIRENGDNKSNQYPEFYKQLHNLKLSIIPHGDRGYFTKKIQVFNNTVGYANEDGGTLIVKEQWLEHPAWTIFLLQDGSIPNQLFDRLSEFLLGKKSVYIPYLGKNDHPAIIKHVEAVELQQAEQIDGIHSLFYKEEVEHKRGTIDDENPYYYKEFVPVSLHHKHNYYELQEIAFTNKKISDLSSPERVFDYNGLKLYFI